MDLIEVKGSIRDLLGDLPRFLPVERLASRRVRWSDNVECESTELFVADMQNILITSCFLPIDLETKSLYLDQSYANLEKFFTIKPKLHLESKSFSFADVNVVYHSGSYVLIGGSPEKNWYHWLLNWLPRLELYFALCPGAAFDKSRKFVFHENVICEPFLSCLSLFGITYDSLLFIDPDQSHVFESLAIPTFGDQNFYYVDLLKRLRARIRNNIQNDVNPIRPRIFISREDFKTAKRRVNNIEELRLTFERLSVATVQLDGMSGLSQFSLFGVSALVMGVHGAGLANLIACNDTAIIIIFDNSRNISSGIAGMFTSLAELFGLEYEIMEVSEVEESGVDYSDFFKLHNRDVHIDCNRLFSYATSRIQGRTQQMAGGVNQMNAYVAKTDALLSSIKPFSGISPPGFDVNYLGIKTAFHLMAHWYPKEGIEFGLKNERRTCTTLPHPSWGEPYFEAGTLIRVMDESGTHPVILELGGGYGARTAEFLKFCTIAGKSGFSLIVEPVPKYVEWAEQHLLENGFPKSAYHVLSAAVSDVSKPVAMNTGYQGFGNEIVRESGQYDLQSSFSLGDLLAGKLEQGSFSISMVNGLSLGDIIFPFDKIDLIDIDVQHLEYAILSPFWDILNTRVSRLHIGTHSIELHLKIRGNLLDQGWLIEVDLHPFSESVSRSGSIKINDGILSAKNTRCL